MDEFFEILVVAEAKLLDNPTKKEALKGLWELAESMGEYLGLGGYVFQKAEEIKTKAARIRERDLYLKEKAGETGISRRSKSRPTSPHRGKRQVTSLPYTSSSTHFSSGHHKRSSTRRHMAVGIAILLLILMGYLYSQGAFDNIKPVFSGESENSSETSTYTYFSGYPDIQTSSETTERPTGAVALSDCSNG